MARPTSSAGASTGTSTYTGSDDGSSKYPSPPRQRRPLSTQQQPGTSAATAPIVAAPNSRQQARPAANQQQSTSTRRNDKERSATDKEKEDKDPKNIGPWRIGRTIGKGSSGRVKIAKHTHTGQYAAVKIVPKHALISSRMSLNEAGAKADKALLGIEREIVIMKLIEHPSVMRLYDVWETGSDLYLILEYVEGGELFDYLVSQGRLKADEALHYFQQIIAGVDYCHRFNICHRDLKPENLLLDRDRNIKIADFGMAALERNDKLLETSCGSPHYASPEIVAGLTYHGSSSDIWSCGIILFALLTGRLPFDDENIRNLLAKVKLGKFQMPQELPYEAKDLIRRMLEVDPARRITMDQIRSHPWFTRRAPKELPFYSSPPSPLQIERPVNEIDEIDADILANLRTLWQGASEDDVIDALISREKTWEKVFYCLLLKYRTRHLENYEEQEQRETKKRSEERSRKHQAQQQITAGPTRSKRSKQSLSDIANGVVDVKPSSRTKTSTPPRPSAYSSRPAPAVPAGVAAASSVRGPGSPRARGPLPQTPDTRSSALFAPSFGSPTPQQEALPSIHLQEPTPQSAERTRDSGIMSPTASAPPSPTPSTNMSTIPPHSPVLPNISIPQVDSPAMQRFFHDVVDQLQAMAIRSTSPTTESSPVFSSPTPSTPGSEHRMSFTPVVRARDQFKGTTTDASQFADAEEGDNSQETAYVPLQQQLQNAMSSPPQQSQQSPSPYTQPLSIRKPVPSINGSPLQPRRSVRQQPTSPVQQPSRPQILRPTSHFATPTSPKVVVPRRGASSMVHTSPPPMIPGAYFESPQDKENYQEQTRKSAFASGSTNGEKKRVTLGLAIAGVSPQQAHISSFEPSGRSSKLKKSKHNSTPSPIFPSLSPALEAASSPKGSWFTNLFSWKTPVNYVLLSTEDVASTRILCKRVLESIGAVVSMENSDGAAVLKCRIEDIRESNGTISSVRPSKFRVEFTVQTAASPQTPSLSPNDNRGQFATCLTLVMEKGAQSTFKATYTRMRAEWQLDTPRPSNSPRFRTTSGESSGSSAASTGLGLEGFRLMPTPSPNLEARSFFGGL